MSPQWHTVTSIVILLDRHSISYFTEFLSEMILTIKHSTSILKWIPWKKSGKDNRNQYWCKYSMLPLQLHALASHKAKSQIYIYSTLLHQMNYRRQRNNCSHSLSYFFSPFVHASVTDKTHPSSPQYIINEAVVVSF